MLPARDAMQLIAGLGCTQAWRAHVNAAWPLLMEAIGVFCRMRAFVYQLVHWVNTCLLMSQHGPWPLGVPNWPAQSDSSVCPCRLDVYILDYLKKRGLNRTAEIFKNESNVPECNSKHRSSPIPDNPSKLTSIAI